MRNNPQDTLLMENSRSLALALLQREIGRLFGVFMALIGLCAFFAIASWNVADPSLSHATDNPVTNWLGFFGASLSDLLMQFFGLAAYAIILPLLSLGVRMAMATPVGSLRKNLAMTIGSVALFTMIFGLFNAPATWPLPVGLGGVIGDMLLGLPALPSSDGEGISAMIGATAGAVTHWWYMRRAKMSQRQEMRQRNMEAKRQMADFDLHEAGLSPEEDDDQDLYAEHSDDDIQSDVPWDDDATIGSARDDMSELAAVAPEMHHEPEAFHDIDDDMTDLPQQNGMRRVVQPQSIQPEAQPAAPAPDRSQVSRAAPRVEKSAPAPQQGSRIRREAQPAFLKTSDFELPELHMLSEPRNIVRHESLSDEALEENARLLETVLEDFGVRGEIIHVRPGPVVTLYELEPAPGIKSSRVIGLADDIARSMSAIAARVAVVPGRNAIGIELPNPSRETVYLRELLASRDYENSKAKLGLALGKTINGDSVIADLAKMPHLLVAGTTGSGKSVAINTMILSLLYKWTPQECRLIMIDPKMLELSVYDGIPHLLTPVVTDPKKAVVALKWTVREMEDRYRRMSKLGVRNVQTGFDRDTGEAIYETEELAFEKMPYIVVIIDEMADLMMVAGKDIEGAVQRLAQMARAAGIHVVMATQRPSVDVITGTIKANFPTRISFQVTSKIDSRTILGEQGAEQLLGMGDMLYMAGGGKSSRTIRLR